MLRLAKQVRFLFVGVVYLTLSAHPPVWAEAMLTKDGTVSVLRDAEHEVSLEDVGSFFDSISPTVFGPNEPDPKPRIPERKKVQDEEKDASKGAKKEAADMPGDAAKKEAELKKDTPTWEAKRGYAPPVGSASQGEVRPSYRVYRAPVVQEDAPAQSSMDYGVFLDTAPKAPEARPLMPQQGRGTETLSDVMDQVVPDPPVPTKKLPPPALADQAPVVQEKQDVPFRARDTVGVPSSSQVVSMVAGVPAGAIPSQFFPIFPHQALADTPAMMLPLVSNYPLADDHSMRRNALIYIHDLSRNVSEAFTMLTMLNGGDRGETMIVAPQFPLEIDVARFASYLPDNGRSVVRWPLGTSVAGKQEGWQIGGDSLPGPLQKNGISSFTATDLLLLFFADRTRFPSLETVTVAGHGMGADFVHRYAALGQAPDVLAKQKIAVRFVAANPSSYLYLTGSRAVASSAHLVKPEVKKCAEYDSFPYGLKDLTAYGRRRGENAIRMGYSERHVTYVFGDKIVSDPYLDQSCAAMGQGKDRLERGQNYQRYLSISFSETTSLTHRFIGLRNVGADPSTIFSSKCGASLLFPYIPEACGSGSK